MWAAKFKPESSKAEMTVHFELTYILRSGGLFDSLLLESELQSNISIKLLLHVKVLMGHFLRDCPFILFACLYEVGCPACEFFRPVCSHHV